MCVPSDGQHAARSLRRAPFPEPSHGLRTRFLVSPKLPGNLCRRPCESCREKTLCFAYFAGPVPEGTLLEENVSISQCCVANGTAGLSTGLEGRP